MESDKRYIPDYNKLHPLGVVTVAVSPDFKQIAASIKEENVVNIYQISDKLPGNWEKVTTLKEHAQTVSVLDWSHQNLLLTGSYDRSVFVWGYNKEKGVWAPEMVMGNTQNRAILDGCWSPQNTKFCFGTGSFKIYIGYVDPENNWWFAETLSKKKFGGSVISVAFHPSGNAIAAGSVDGTVRVYTSFLEGIDKTPNYNGPLKDVRTKGEELFRVDTGAWVESIAWSPLGDFALVSSHHSITNKLAVTQDGGIDYEENAIVWDKLPFRSSTFLGNGSFLAGGYDRKPVLLKGTGGGKWETVKVFDKESKKARVSTAVKSNLQIFESGKKAAEKAEEKEGHSNPIVCVRKLGESKFLSVDTHGNLFTWDV